MNLRLPLAVGTLALALILGACSSNEPQTDAAKSTPSTEPAATTAQQPAAEPAAQPTTPPAVEPEKTTTQVASSDQPTETQNPDLVQFTAVDLSGKQRKSSEWMGKQPVVINFWGTWCPPCRKEIPDLVKVYSEFKGKGVEIVSLAVNDTPEKVKDYATQAQMDWVMLMGDQDVAQVFGGIRGVPTTIFYDRTGKEVGRFVGGRDYDTFHKAFEMIAGS
jgi:thiol-disulfide isomerase/thioredoxin